MEYPTAAFADQIIPGMVIDPTAQAMRPGSFPDVDLVTVTGVRHRKTPKLGALLLDDDEPTRVRVSVIGVYADGRPYAETFGSAAAVFVYQVPPAPDSVP